MLVIEELVHGEELRFTEPGRRVDGISQKMSTQTPRRMERDGLLVRTIHTVIPPKVEYRLTHLGLSLGEAFCGLWVWAEQISVGLKGLETILMRGATSQSGNRPRPRWKLPLIHAPFIGGEEREAKSGPKHAWEHRSLRR